MELFVLKSCDTCRKAKKALEAAGIDARITDIRADGLSRDKIAWWLDAVGAARLVNRKSTTWRGLSENEKLAAENMAGALELLYAHPTLIKRPVIERDGLVLVGWGSEVQTGIGL